MKSLDNEEKAKPRAVSDNSCIARAFHCFDHLDDDVNYDIACAYSDFLPQIVLFVIVQVPR